MLRIRRHYYERPVCIAYFDGVCRRFCLPAIVLFVICSKFYRFLIYFIDISLLIG